MKNLKDFVLRENDIEKMDISIARYAVKELMENYLTLDLQSLFLELNVNVK
ncbi:conserved domain protein [Peptoniphilus sp. oral taxon 375 str. F0436]|nr:conserved domain protein [Peptoniphilus sp. oral taxon 375 str. F0436]